MKVEMCSQFFFISKTCVFLEKYKDKFKFLMLRTVKALKLCFFFFFFLSQPFKAKYKLPKME